MNCNHCETKLEIRSGFWFCPTCNESGLKVETVTNSVVPENVWTSNAENTGQPTQTVTIPLADWERFKILDQWWRHFKRHYPTTSKHYSELFGVPTPDDTPIEPTPNAGDRSCSIPYSG